MAFYQGSTKVFPSGVLTAPDSVSNGAILSNDGTNTFWSYPGVANAAAGSGWRYRSILTHGYTAAGYKGSNPWRSVNKTWHQTDTTVYCGEQIDRAVSYIDGTYSDLNAYIHGGSGFQGNGTNTSSYNLYNGTMRQALSKAFSMFGSGTAPYGYDSYDPKNEGLNYGDQSNLAGHGGWDLSTSRFNHGCASSTPGNGESAGAGYVFGGSTTVTERLHFPTEIMYNTTAAPVTWGATDAIGGQNRAYVLGNSSTAANYYFTWSNQTFTSWGYNGYTSDGNNKSLATKWGHMYGSYGGNTNSTRVKYSDATTSVISTFSKLSNFGEENQQMGQDWGYMMGNYNGQQNNWTTKTNYSTDVETTLGFAAQPKGHYGTSSGACSSAAASVCGVERS